jgi:hypothetical protein
VNVEQRIRDLLEDRVRLHLEARAFERAKPPKVAAWNVGKCVRQLWYGEHGHEPDPLTPRALDTFSLGDSIEDAEVSLLAGAGVPILRTDEGHHSVRLDPPGLVVRPDYLLFLDHDTVLPCDVKSMSNRTFARALKGQLDRTYEWQMECYLRAFRADVGVVHCYRKETSARTNVLVWRDDERWNRIVEAVEVARGQDLPDRPYSASDDCPGIADGKCVNGRTPTGRQAHSGCGGTGKNPDGAVLVYPCSYCPYKSTCWGEVEMFFTNDGEPRWRVVA